jgi:hypothetical protein
MRRLLVVAVALLAVFGMVMPATAQAPAPKVTITGLIDQVGTYTKNMSTYDFNYNRTGDNQMYARTRGRFDVIGEVGKAKAVLGLEIDAYWGQTGFIDSNTGPGCVSTAAGAVTCGATGSGAESSFDLNTDVQGNIQVKWLYTEFPMFLVPDTTVRLGAQPFGTAATYKLAVYANGDFPGVNWVTNFGPNARLNFTVVHVEEQLTGKRDFPAVAGLTAATNQAQLRGEDKAIIVSFEFSPFKGLDIKPMYSYFNAIGPTSGSSRQGRGGLSIATTPGTFTPFGGFDGSGTGIKENRHTIGLDARWTAGPFSVQPTILYQFGDRDSVITSAAFGVPGTKVNSDLNAWLFDVRAGYQVGPLSIGFMGMYTTGDSAQSSPHGKVHYFQPLNTDTSYAADWGTQILSLGIDYYQILYGAATGVNPGVAIGYDKYGRIQGGVKVAYAITPALTVGAGVTAAWTAEDVDTDSTFAAASGLTPAQVCRNTLANCRPEGDHSSLGYELNASLTYRFAPGLAFDLAGGYLFAGPALGHRYLAAPYSAANPPVTKDVGVEDVQIVTARVRYQF